MPAGSWLMLTLLSLQLFCVLLSINKDLYCASLFTQGEVGR